MAGKDSRGVLEGIEDSMMEVDDEEGESGGMLGNHEREEQQTEDKGFPAHWMKMPSNTMVMAVELCKTLDEYNTILAQFLTSIGEFEVEVTRIFRIQSSFLWRHFLLKREEMRIEHGGREVLERQLFHGTKCPNIDGICHKGFDWRLSTRTKYGAGCYFAVNSSYSHVYSQSAEHNHNLPLVLRPAASVTSVSPSHSPLQHSHTPPHHHLFSPSQAFGNTSSSQAFGNTSSSQAFGNSSSLLFGNPSSSQLFGNTSSSQLFGNTSSSQLFGNLPPPFPLSPPSHSPNQDTFSGCSPSSAPSFRGLRYMFVGRVLVGRTVQGHSSYRRPPAVQPGNPCGPSFNTCVDNEQDPKIFVVFDSNQAYPEYLLEYTTQLER